METLNFPLQEVVKGNSKIGIVIRLSTDNTLMHLPKLGMQ